LGRDHVSPCGKIRRGEKRDLGGLSGGVAKKEKKGVIVW